MAKKKPNKTPKNNTKTTGKNKSKTKAASKLKTLVSKAHPVPETFVQKQCGRISEKLSRCSRLVTFKNKVVKFYHMSIEKCKRLIYQV